MTYNNFAEFDAYTNKSLTNAQREEFEQEIANNADVSAELADYQQFRHSIESIKLKQTLEAIHTRLDRQGALTEAPPLPVVVRSRQRFRPVWAIAGLLLLLAGIGLYRWMGQEAIEPPTLAGQTFQEYYNPETQARTNTTCARDLAPGLLAYRAKNYRAALDAFEKLPADLACMPYYRGITQLALNHPKEATTELERALTEYPDETDLTHQKAGWYLALAYLKANRIDDARTRLNAITQQQGHPYATVSRQVLADLGHE